MTNLQRQQCAWQPTLVWGGGEGGRISSDKFKRIVDTGIANYLDKTKPTTKARPKPKAGGSQAAGSGEQPLYKPWFDNIDWWCAMGWHSEEIDPDMGRRTSRRMVEEWRQMKKVAVNTLINKKIATFKRRSESKNRD